MANEDNQHHDVLIPTIREMSSWAADDPKINKPHHFAKAITEHLNLSDEQKDETDFLADRLLDKLESALMYYQMNTASDFDTRNISQQRTIYEGLYSNLWSWYKGRVQNYLKSMGWDLTMFFCSSKNFEKYSKKFVQENPDHADLVDLAKKQRDAWQSDFAQSRNTAEHSGDYRDGTEQYETKADAKRLFAQVCWTAETLIAYCGSYKMDEAWNISEVNPGVTIFDEEQKFIVEHAAQTAHREKSNQ